MSRIRIKNFGPIKEGFLENDGWMDIKKVTVFIGNQASGKSTIAKVFSTLNWLEKSIHRSDVNIGEFSFAKFKELFIFQGVQEYFQKNTIIEFSGDKYYIKYGRNEKYPIIKEEAKHDYLVPKILYVPAERNLLSAIENAFDIKGLPKHLFTFGQEFKKAQKRLNSNSVELPIVNYFYKYDEFKDTSYVSGPGHQVNLLQASSGFQSTIPLFIVTKHLAELILRKDFSPNENMSVNKAIQVNEEISLITSDANLSDQAKMKRIQEIQSRYINNCFINIVEEPEQNLFPTSQRQLLNSLLEFNNMSKRNKLIMTTHSPYLLNYLTLAVKAEMVKTKLSSENSKKKLSEIVPLESTVKSEDLVIYELNEKDGSIIKLGDYKGLPSDENYLNGRLEDSNELFAQLQEIEKGWR